MRNQKIDKNGAQLTVQDFLELATITNKFPFIMNIERPYFLALLTPVSTTYLGNPYDITEASNFNFVPNVKPEGQLSGLIRQSWAFN